MQAKNEAMIEHLLMQGAIEMAGIDNNGQMYYNITYKLKEVNHKLYEELYKQYTDHMFRLIDKGPEIMHWRINVD